MKIKLPSLPFWARSPSYRRNINRRLASSIWTAPIQRDLERRAEIDALRNLTAADLGRIRDGYHRADFTAGPCYLPDDEHPRLARRWRWWVDPIVIGMSLGFVVLGVALFVLAGV